MPDACDHAEINQWYHINRLLSTTETKHQVQGRLLLDVVVAKSAAILELLASEDQSLLVRWDALLVLDLRLYVINSV